MTATSTDLMWEPTRAEGLRRLDDFAPASGRYYGEHRNSDLGPDDRTNVSTLSPYIRHRLVAEPEVAAAAIRAHGPRGAERFLQEVGWRTYWKGWLELRPSAWHLYQAEVRRDLDRLESNPGLRARYEAAVAGRSGIASFDAWARELVEVGYLHNHARMWFASLWIFTLDLPWALGADYFMEHLLCGDPAANTLSWRWVAGLQTKGKAYLADAANIAKFTGGRFKPKEHFADQARRVEGFANPDPEPGALPPPDALDPDRPFGLLLTEDDLRPEDFDLPRRAIRGVAALTGESGRSPRPVSPQVAEFTRGAADDGLARAAAHFEAPAAGRLDPADWTRSIADWAGSIGVDQVVVPHVPVGPARDRLDPAAAALAGRIRLVRVRRPWDADLWPLATAGYFPFREKYLKRVDRLAGAGAV